MRYYAAPMEGITGYIYRNTHHECFGGCDRYYMPFIDPKDQASLMRKEKKDIAPDNNRGIPVIPQILTNRADKFLTTVNMLADLGYTEANLNFLMLFLIRFLSGSRLRPGWAWKIRKRSWP